MIPIKNKKKSFEDTVQEMRDFSMKYIEKYAPSKQQLRTYLLKKYLIFGAVGIKKNEIKDLIDVVLSDLENSKYLNDKFYSNSKAKNLIQRGSSINKIRSYLMSKGINQKFVKETLNKIKDENEDQDFFSALKVCKKKELDQQELKVIELYFIKRIFHCWQEMVSILIRQNELWIFQKKSTRKSLVFFSFLIFFY